MEVAAKNEIKRSVGYYKSLSLQIVRLRQDQTTRYKNGTYLQHIQKCNLDVLQKWNLHVLQKLNLSGIQSTFLLWVVNIKIPTRNAFVIKC